MKTFLSQASRKYTLFMLLIFLVAVGLRFGLVRYNRDANDTHDEVIIWIMETGKLPDKQDCWECFQPKLFHYTNAKLLQLAGVNPDNTDKHVNLGAELLNFAAGILTLIVVAVTITRISDKSELLRLISFGLVALNPDLISINSQTTNDTFAILFSTLALFFTIKYLKEQKLGTFALIILFTILGIASKTNVWVTAIAITVALLIKAWVQRKRVVAQVLTGLAFIGITLGLSILNPLTQYVSNYQKYGSPTLVNTDRQPLPRLIAKTEAVRPGLLSISDGIFTFKYLDLLKHPLIKNSETYDTNRTSLWTQVYGRAHSVHFPNWPATWSAKGEEGSNLTRALFIFALPPALLLILGVFLESGKALKILIKRDDEIAEDNAYSLMTTVFIGYVLFLVLYTILYRDFAVMKAIFLYPALLGFQGFFMCGIEFIKTRLIGHLQWARIVGTAWVGVLFILYGADIITMIQLIYSRVSLK